MPGLHPEASSRILPERERLQIEGCPPQERNDDCQRNKYGECIAPVRRAHRTGDPRLRFAHIAIVGAAIVTGADLAVRTLVPGNLPVGIATTAIGGTALLYTLLRATRKVSV